MDLNDVTPDKFFDRITFQSDPKPDNKLRIPDADFILCSILLRLINVIQNK